MNIDSTYHLCKGVQVRPEKFGLLFYCYAGPKLYFVPSGDLLEVGFFHGRQTLGDLMATVRQARKQPHEAVKQKLLKLLNMLTSKGLVYEQPLR
jgi:putative mycofactocin binding protein MftB